MTHAMGVWMAAARDVTLGTGATAAGGTAATVIAAGVTDAANVVGGTAARATVGQIAIATTVGETATVGGIGTSTIVGATLLAGVRAITVGGSGLYSAAAKPI